MGYLSDFTISIYSKPSNLSVFDTLLLVKQIIRIVSVKNNKNGFNATATIEEFTEVTNPIQNVIAEVSHFFKNM
jgi:hypothetical protein